MNIGKEMKEYLDALSKTVNTASGSEKERIENLRNQIGQLLNGSRIRTEPSISRLTTAFISLFNQMQESDNPLTSQVITAVKVTGADFEKLKLIWARLKKPA